VAEAFKLTRSSGGTAGNHIRQIGEVEDVPLFVRQIGKAMPIEEVALRDDISLEPDGY
jgi:hypothetical protein